MDRRWLIMPLREAAFGSNLVGRSAAKCRVWPNGIVEVEVLADAGAGLGDGRVGVEVHLFVFHRASEALHEHIVAPAAFPVHADGDLLAVEDGGERRARELRTLIAVEDCWPAMAGQRFLQRLDAELGIERDRHPPCQHAPGEPVTIATR